MKGALAFLLLGSVSAVPYKFNNYYNNNARSGSYGGVYEKLFNSNSHSRYATQDQPLSFTYMKQPMAAVDVSSYHGANNKMVGQQFFKHEGDHHGNHGNHGSHHGHGDEENEELPYTVVQDFGPYELREYPTTKFSCVKSEIDNAEDPMAGLKNVNPMLLMGSKRWRKTPTSVMFGELFKYISGVNKEGKKISMTAPVSTHHKIIERNNLGDLEEVEMCFYIPAEHQANPPQPLESSPVFVHTRPTMRVYAHRFGGHPISADDWTEQHELLEALTMGKKTHQDEYFTNGYDSPMQMFNRRNEVWMEDTSFVKPDVSDERVIVAGEEAVAEPEHVPEEDLSIQINEEE